MPLKSQPSVLIVDSSEETREVLQTALERRGVRILAARCTRQGLELARTHHPDLIVLDLEFEGAAAEPRDTSAPFAVQSRADRAPLIVLGSVRRPHRAPAGTMPAWSAWSADAEFVAKPYHYGPLIRRIEELLGSGSRGPRPCRRCS
jgi:CheY-like chemotaxis protein